MIERTHAFNIGEKKFVVNFPNVGQILDMESLKQALTDNRYGAMVVSGIASMYHALDLVDTIVFFQVCIPSIAKYYNIQNYTSLSLDKIQDLVKVYKEEIKPWYEKVMSDLKEVVKNENESRTDSEKES